MDETEAQLARIFSYGAGLDSFGVDSFSADPMLYALGQAAENAAMLYGATAPQAQAAQQAVIARQQQMQRLQMQAAARAAGMTPFSTTAEGRTIIKKEMLPITPTLIPAGAGGNAGLLAPASITFAVRPTRSMQINRISFPSGDAATAACVLMSVQILGVEQLNGPGGVPCGQLTEVQTDPNLKGATAQAGQDILITIGNASAVDQVIRGTFYGPDMVRST